MPEGNVETNLEVLVRSRAKTYYEGKASSVTSNNDTGVFDVLFGHANFITLVKDFVLISPLDSEEKKFEIDTGVMRVVGNKVDVYLTV